ncbi:MAG: hypothetical protein ACI9BD_000795 [Candidatus Marinamargulisbacteria bacterium]|jgi:hypothetical protein
MTYLNLKLISIPIAVNTGTQTEVFRLPDKPALFENQIHRLEASKSQFSRVVTDFLAEKSQLIQDTIDDAHGGGKLVVYGSCPISSFGAEHMDTFRDISHFVQSQVAEHFGSEQIHYLNPSDYQHFDDAIKGMFLSEDIASKGMSENKFIGECYMIIWRTLLLKPGNFQIANFLSNENVRSYFSAQGKPNVSAPFHRASFVRSRGSTQEWNSFLAVNSQLGFQDRVSFYSNCKEIPNPRPIKESDYS